MIKPLYWNSQNLIERLERILREDGVVLTASDTVFGLMARVCQGGFEALNHIKGRSEKPYLILIKDFESLLGYVALEDALQIENMARHCWPGPVTFILKAAHNTPSFLKGSHGTVALRVPRHEGLLQLLAHFDGLFSTSANKAGQPVPAFFGDIDQDILMHVAAVVLEPDNQSASIQPSTILDCTGRLIKVIRRGAYPIEELEKIHGTKFI